MRTRTIVRRRPPTPSLECLLDKCRELGTENYIYGFSRKKVKSKKFIQQVIVDELHRQQKGKCAICRMVICAESGPLTVRRAKGHLDHCHRTEKIRGLICSHCNLMLGFGNDNPTVLEKGAKYLRKFVKKNIFATDSKKVEDGQDLDLAFA